MIALALAFQARAETPPRWPAETVRLFERLPIQEGGRVKPMASYARYSLLRFSGKTSCVDEQGRRVSAGEWLLNSLLYPVAAREYPIFRVDNPEVMTALGLDTPQKRDRYAYKRLAPVREKLLDLARGYSAIDDRQRTPVQRQLLKLALDLLEFEALTGALAFFQTPISLKDEAHLPGLSWAAGDCTGAQLLAPWLSWRLQHPQADALPPEIALILRNLPQQARIADIFTIIPPGDESPEWLTPGTVLDRVIASPGFSGEAVVLLAYLADAMASIHDLPVFQEKLARFHSAVTVQTQLRKECRHLDLEAFYLRVNLVYWAQVLFIAVFLGASMMLLEPWRLVAPEDTRAAEKSGHRADALLTGAILTPALLLACAIVIRCIIRGRPPATTLYETMLFGALAAVLISLGIAVLYRQRTALAAAAFLGALGLFLANRYEMSEARDTMPALAAVLDTNFWLATHVTTVVIGYGAGLLASVMAHGYILSKFLFFRALRPAYYRDLTRMVYGAICFSLVFTMAGTLLGGIWAAESWGRFWGWDPKENGALMIILWQLALIHAKRGGLAHEAGIHLAAIFGGVIVIFSWLGVNQLGVGLHAYGFTSGMQKTLQTFYLIELGVLVLGGAIKLRDDWRHLDAPQDPL